MKKSMKKSLAIILASLVYMENTSLMASGVEEISQDTHINRPGDSGQSSKEAQLKKF